MFDRSTIVALAGNVLRIGVVANTELNLKN